MNKIINIKYLTIGLFLAAMALHNLQAQEKTSMYFLKSIPQSVRLNPATTPDYRAYFGGLVVPVLGQVPPPLNIELSTGFSAGDLLYKPFGIYGDSLVTIFHDVNKARSFFNELDPVIKLVDFHTYIDLLHVGFKTNEIFWHISMVEKIETEITVPRDLFRLPLYGNAGFPSSTVDLSGIGAAAVHYRELGVGASYQLTENLSLGAKAKALFGMSNVDMAKTNIEWYTDPQTSEYKFRTEFVINASQPAYDIHDLRYDTNGDSLIFKHTKHDMNQAMFQDYALNMKNMGLAFDFGAVYSPVDKVNIHASVTDLGFIKWKDNVTNLHAKASDFNFKGIDIMKIDASDSTREDYFEEMLDSLILSLNPELRHQAYTTRVPTKFYLGGEYQLTKMLSVGLLYRGVQWTDKIASSFTASANLNKEGLGAVVSYTYSTDYGHNIGIGGALRLGGWQTFIVTDNILALDPMKGRHFTIRLGTNWIFRGKKTAQLVE